MCLRNTLTLKAFSDDIQNAYNILMFTLKGGWIYIHNCLDIDINVTVEVWELERNFIPRFTEYVITYPSRD